MTVLSCRDVVFYYGGKQSSGRAVLDKVDLDVEENEFITILGPSGCGKTSLLRLMAGFERVTGGSIVYDGKEVTRPDAERVVVFQQPWLYPWLSLRENVAFGLKLHKRKIDWARVDEMIDIVGLTQFVNHPPYQLSGGMQQRAALARALVMSPKLLLMDEPFGALDAQTRQNLQAFLLELCARVHVTVVFITHDIEEAILLGDRMFIMGTDPGSMIFEQKVDLPRPRNEATTVTAPFQEIRKRALETLSKASMAAAGITGVEPSQSAHAEMEAADGPETDGRPGAAPSIGEEYAVRSAE
jgi:NitT/TauT family transport system ATP-binding protein